MIDRTSPFPSNLFLSPASAPSRGRLRGEGSVERDFRPSHGQRGDEVLISEEARRLFERERVDVKASPQRSETDAANGRELSGEDAKRVAQLKKRDREVRQHEQAHLAALGGGQASFSYEIGPDGQRYAVEGEVPVDIGAVPGDSRATIRRAQTVARAALAPSDPSAADRQAAARARSVELEARAELRAERTESSKPDGDGVSRAPRSGEIAGLPAHAHEGDGCRLCTSFIESL